MRINPVFLAMSLCFVLLSAYASSAQVVVRAGTHAGRHHRHVRRVVAPRPVVVYAAPRPVVYVAPRPVVVVPVPRYAPRPRHRGRRW